MKNFSELGIEAPPVRTMQGNKISLLTILNREITVHDYLIKPSNYGKEKNCLHMQISLADTKHVVFTGYKSLIGTIEQIAKEDFPFKTTIIKKDERFLFT